MNAIRRSVALPISLLVSALVGSATAAIRDHDPTVVGSAVSQNGPSLSTGELSHTELVMTVPGRGGLNVPLTLSYAAGIRVEQEASWVGLGWNLSPGVIVQEVNGDPDDSATNGWFRGNARDKKDQDGWFMSLGGEFQRIVFVNSDADGDGEKDGYLQNWSAVKIRVHRLPVMASTMSERIGWVEVIQPDGTEYIFGSRLMANDSPAYNGFHYSLVREDQKLVTFTEDGEETFYCDDRPCKQHYALALQLTEIHSPDYVDANSNQMADDADRGNWARFRYVDYTCLPSERVTPSDPFSGCKSTAVAYAGGAAGWPYFYPSTQTSWGPQKDSPTDWTFVQRTTQSIPGVPASYGFGDLYMSRMVEIDQTFLAEILTPTHRATFVTGDRWDLRSVKMTTHRAKRLERIELYRRANNSLVGETRFSYAETYPLASGAPGSPSGKGRLTLQSFTVCGRSNVCLPSTEFEYANNSGAGAGDNPVYSIVTDDWGYVPSIPEAWSLTKVKSSQGAVTEFEYEADQFAFENGLAITPETGGGIRVSKIVESSGLVSQVKRYEYEDGAITRRPHVITGGDDVWHTFTIIKGGFLGGSRSSEVTYGLARETAGVSGKSYGYTETEFVTTVDLPDTEHPDINGFPQTSAAWKRGQIKTQKIYNSSDALVSRTDYTYTTQSSNLRRYLDDDQDGYPYAIDSGWVTLASASTTDFEGGQSISKIVTYNGFDSTNGLPTSVTESAGGKSKTTYTSYCHSDSNTNCRTNARNPGQPVGDVLDARHILSFPFVYRVVDEVGNVLSYGYSNYEVLADGETDPVRKRAYPYQTLGWLDVNRNGLIEWGGTDHYIGETVMERDVYGHVLRIRTTGGVETSTEFGSAYNNALPTKVTAANGSYVTTAYDAYVLKPTSVTRDGDATTTVFTTYDNLGRESTVTSPNGTVTTTTYVQAKASGVISNTNLNIVSTTVDSATVGEDNRISKTMSDGFGRTVLALVQGDGKFLYTKTEYNTVGKAYKTHIPYAGTSATYNYGAITDSTSEGYSLTEFEDSPRARVRKQYPSYSKDSSMVTELIYEVSGNDLIRKIKVSKSANGFVWTKAQTNIDGTSASVFSDSADGTTFGQNSDSVYDRRGNLLSVTDPRGNSATYTYDSFDRRLSASYPEQDGASTAVYADDGRILEERDPKLSESGVHIHHFYDDSLLRETTVCVIADNIADANAGHCHSGGATFKIDTQYDNYSGISSSIVSPTSLEIGWAKGKITRISSSRETRIFLYNALGQVTRRITRVVSPVDGTMVSFEQHYSYNGFGELKSETLNPEENPDDALSYAYNGLGQLDTIKAPGDTAALIDFGFNSLGVLNTITRKNGVVTSYFYDNLKRLDSFSTSGLAKGFGRQFDYDHRGNLTQISDQNNRILVGTASNCGSEYNETNYPMYGNRNQVLNACVASYLSTSGTSPSAKQFVQYDYDAAGNRLWARRTDKQGSSGRLEWSQHDIAAESNRLLSFKLNYDLPPQTTFDYDGNGNITARHAPEGTTTYAYDFLNRLYQVTFPDGKSEWVYYGLDEKPLIKQDAQGNFRVTLYEGDEVLYERELGRRAGDADGNGIHTISDAVFLITYIFGSGSAPSPLEKGDANGDGLISISDAVFLIQFIFGGGPAPSPIDEDDFGTRFVRTNGQTLAEIKGNSPTNYAVTYVHTDHLGSISLRSSASGLILAEMAYDPFGLALESNGDIGRYQFTGKEYDVDAKLYDYGARRYDPLLGRFVSRDTNVDEHPYSYARGNPLRFNDPSGHRNGDPTDGWNTWETATVLPGDFAPGPSGFIGINREMYNLSMSNEDLRRAGAIGWGLGLLMLGGWGAVEVAPAVMTMGTATGVAAMRLGERVGASMSAGATRTLDQATSVGIKLELALDAAVVKATDAARWTSHYLGSQSFSFHSKFPKLTESVHSFVETLTPPFSGSGLSRIPAVIDGIQGFSLNNIPYLIALGIDLASVSLDVSELASSPGFDAGDLGRRASGGMRVSGVPGAINFGAATQNSSGQKVFY